MSWTVFGGELGAVCGYKINATGSGVLSPCHTPHLSIEHDPSSTSRRKVWPEVSPSGGPPSKDGDESTLPVTAFGGVTSDFTNGGDGEFGDSS